MQKISKVIDEDNTLEELNKLSKVKKFIEKNTQKIAKKISSNEEHQINNIHINNRQEEHHENLFNGQIYKHQNNNNNNFINKKRKHDK